MSIEINNLTHIYDENGPQETLALKDINLSIDDGDFIGLIGHTGSGKSTLIQYFNALLIPDYGSVYINNIDTSEKKDLKEIRQKVGLVFQYPEYQLFEETVKDDVAFGPKNLNLKKEEIDNRVRESLALVGIDYQEVKDRSPFSLSGGQKRRVAIAGVLAMKPEILILDEPAAGLDPRGRNEILTEIKRLHEEIGLTVILVSHSMEDVARYAHRLFVLCEGELVYSGETREIFTRAEKLKEMGLGVPQVTELMQRLRKKGFNVRKDIFTVKQASEELMRAKRRCNHV